MENIYDIGPGDTWWAASDVGLGGQPPYIVYAPLLVGATTIVYEGKPVGTPDAAAFWRGHRQTRGQGTVHRTHRDPGHRKGGPRGIADRQPRSVEPAQPLFLAGERLDPDTTTGLHGCPRRPGGRQLVAADRDRLADRNEPRGLEPLPLARVAVGGRPGHMTLRIVDGQGDAPAGIEGIVIRLPLPPGTLPTLATPTSAINGCLSGVPRVLTTGDGGTIDADGYLYVLLGRTDDVINVAGPPTVNRA